MWPSRRRPGAQRAEERAVLAGETVDVGSWITIGPCFGGLQSDRCEIRRLVRCRRSRAAALGGVHNNAIGFAGLPVPRGIRRGSAMNMNSYLRSSAQTAASDSRYALS